VKQSTDHRICSERVVGRDPVFVDDAIFVDLFHKIEELSSKDAVLTEDKSYCERESFQLVKE
jgi:hypothetical protein